MHPIRAVGSAELLNEDAPVLCRTVSKVPVQSAQVLC